MLIQKAIDYTIERYGETKYIFVNENNVSCPLQYTTIKYKVLAMIQRKKLRDDDGKPFGFNSHMFRHYYGVKLTEMHLDDWTIAKLLGHAGTKNGAKISVKSSKYTVTYQLNDSRAAKELYAQLPLTLKVENYSDSEKIFYPPKELKTNGTPKSKGRKGSLSYYAPWGDVVMFYETAGSASGLYELGMVVSGEEYISKLSGKISISKL